MRMLGEMAVANPSTGSFADYALQSVGGWAGFSVGWLYWYFWVIVVGFEAVAGAGTRRCRCRMYRSGVDPHGVDDGDQPVYGEFEYWFAGVKVFPTRFAFIALGTLFVLGAMAGPEPRLN